MNLISVLVTHCLAIERSNIAFISHHSHEYIEILGDLAKGRQYVSSEYYYENYMERQLS